MSRKTRYSLAEKLFDESDMLTGLFFEDINFIFIFLNEI